MMSPFEVYVQQPTMERTMTIHKAQPTMEVISTLSLSQGTIVVKDDGEEELTIPIQSAHPI